MRILLHLQQLDAKIREKKSGLKKKKSSDAPARKGASSKGELRDLWYDLLGPPPIVLIWQPQTSICLQT